MFTITRTLEENTNLVSMLTAVIFGLEWDRVLTIPTHVVENSKDENDRMLAAVLRFLDENEKLGQELCKIHGPKGHLGLPPQMIVVSDEDHATITKLLHEAKEVVNTSDFYDGGDWSAMCKKHVDFWNSAPRSAQA